jgi:hypothetical protein
MISSITYAAFRDELTKIAHEVAPPTHGHPEHAHAAPKKAKEDVYEDVAKKFPELAHRGTKEKDGGMEAGPQPSGVQPLPGMARGGPPGGTGMQAGLGGA